jgi:hypothetical protein
MQDARPDPAAAAVLEGSRALARMREGAVQRLVQRLTAEEGAGWALQQLRAKPADYPPLTEGNPQLELQMLRMLVTLLLDPKITLPVDVESLHRRVG